MGQKIRLHTVEDSSVRASASNEFWGDRYAPQA